MVLYNQVKRREAIKIKAIDYFNSFKNGTVNNELEIYSLETYGKSLMQLASESKLEIPEEEADSIGNMIDIFETIDLIAESGNTPSQTFTVFWSDEEGNAKKLETFVTDIEAIVYAKAYEANHSKEIAAGKGNVFCIDNQGNDLY